MMTRISWDNLQDRLYEAGVDRGVFYPPAGPGVPWNGLLKVTEDTEDTGLTALYVDGQRYVTQLDLGTFSATLGAITYPIEFEPYDGYSGPISSGQRRLPFSLAYRTKIGNPIDGIDFAYRLHLVYNALAQPTQRENQSLSNDTNLDAFEWSLTTTPIAVPGKRPTAHLILDSRFVPAASLQEVEDILYGTIVTTPVMPTVAQIYAIFESHAIVTVTALGDGVWEVSGPDNMVTDLGSTVWQFSWPNLEQIDDHLYVVSSY